MSKIKQLIIVVTTAVIFLIIGITIPSSSDFQNGWEAAEKRLSETNFGLVMGVEDMEIKSVSGVVQEKKGNKITLKIQPLSPLADPELDFRIIEIEGANFYELVRKNPEQFHKEMNWFEKEVKRRDGLELDSEQLLDFLILPEMYLKQPIDTVDFVIGQEITVIAEENIRDKKQFKAEEIIIQSFLGDLDEILSPLTEEGLDTLPTTETEM